VTFIEAIKARATSEVTKYRELAQESSRLTYKMERVKRYIRELNALLGNIIATSEANNGH
jgi:hypothetical protein